MRKFIAVLIILGLLVLFDLNPMAGLFATLIAVPVSSNLLSSKKK